MWYQGLQTCEETAEGARGLKQPFISLLYLLSMAFLIDTDSKWKDSECLFLEAMTEPDAGNDIPKDEFWRVYFNWCMSKRYPAISKIAFGRRVKRWIPRIRETRPLVDGKQTTCWRGLRLKEKIPLPYDPSDPSDPLEG